MAARFPSDVRPGPATRRARLAVAALFFANGCGLGSWVPHIPDVKLWHGLSDAVLGLALLAIAAGAVAALPVAGALVARSGSRPVTRGAALLFCAALPLPLLAPDLPTLLAALALLGTGTGALDVAMNAHAVLVETRYGRPIMSSFHGLFSVGGLAGAALAGGAMHAGLAPIAHLAAAAFVLAIAALAAWPALLPTAPAAVDGPLFVLPRGRLIGLGAIAIIGLMAEGAMGDWSAVYLRMDLGATAGTAASGFAAFSLAMALGRLTGDRLVARFGRAALLACGALTGGATLGAALLAAKPFAAVLGFAGMGFGLANVVPIAAVSTAGYFGFLAGPPLIGFVAEASSLTVALGLVAAVVGLMALGGSAPERRLAEAAALAG
jgi:fucose permease